jgi:streptomycin 6-kinase
MITEPTILRIGQAVQLLMAGDPHERATWLAARAGCDPTAIWEWGVVERGQACWRR